MNVKLDLLDEKLLRLLGQDAQQTGDALAKQLKVSPATIRRRKRELLRNKVLHIVGVVDPNKVVFTLTAIIAFDVVHEKLASFLEMLASRPEINWVATVTGRFDIIAQARFRSTEELSDFLQAEGFKDSETFVCLNVKKGAEMSLP